MRVLALILLIASLGIAQRKGEVAPPLAWDKLTGNCPAKPDLADLNGKVVVPPFGNDFPTPQDVADWNNLPKSSPVSL